MQYNTPIAYLSANMGGDSGSERIADTGATLALHPGGNSSSRLSLSGLITPRI